MADYEKMKTAELNLLVRDRFFPLDPARCRVCGWPLKQTVDEGCIEGNCSQRPGPKRRYDEPGDWATDIRLALNLALVLREMFGGETCLKWDHEYAVARFADERFCAGVDIEQGKPLEALARAIVVAALEASDERGGL